MRILALLICALCLTSLGSERTIVCFGDSVTACTRPPWGSCPVPENETYVARLAAALSRTVVNAGLSGSTAGDSVARFDTDVAPHKPEIVVVMFGLNDEYYSIPVEQYIESISAIHRKTKRLRAAFVLMTPNPTRDAERNQRLKPYVEALRAYAAKQRVRLVDNYTTFAESNIEGTTVESATYDAIHPNGVGQGVIAGQLIAAFSVKPTR